MTPDRHGQRIRASSALGRLGAVFLALNAVGTGILAIVAGMNSDIGFTLLEGVWSIISFRGLARALKAPWEAVA